MDRAGVERWIEAYRKAWTTDATEDIEALFTEDVTYSPYPWPREQNRWRGRDAVVRKWQGHGDSQVGWRFEHDILAVEDDTAVIQGWTAYDRGEGEPWEEAFANIWLVRFADDGRAREFAEWWVQKPTKDEG
ncbi:MAG TPA: nuclear transport factor 2 family protein [Candidatus Limnocylindria bacterium]|nr:nuclear transport factor 2 family protein [Candidatus Limnocylindria bacterium]